ncbi:MAG: aryl-sulfate sulfotransferase [Flavobacteriales bacterium]|jgi:hypothetical protein|nr:aryl-sulfate sulfotransferase [Flavobacteriales bacterium]MBK7112670.1 aryl-sulfate sulfotransferase [Flavobacteriales bacterium]MBK8708394.1 aryl-sulfate sulfotransferase [Flavobacteriales bacterium]
MSRFLSVLSVVLLPVLGQAQQTTGLFLSDPGTDDGYILWGAMFGHDQYLMNTCGEVVHTWVGDGLSLGNSMYLLEDGTLLRCAKADTANGSLIIAGGGGERIQKVDWNGNVTWDFVYYDAEKRLHHDIAPMPNGNILAIAWVLKDQSACIAAGRIPADLPQGRLFDERIIEIEPTGPTTGNIIWQWDLWDHLVQEVDSTKDNYGVVADHPELLNINWLNQAVAIPGQADWIHLNAIDYNAELDQIVLSSQIMSEIWILDHSTTTEEAAGHSGGTYGKGGDLLYRYGNPQVYDRGTTVDQMLWRQHDAHWIPSGFPDGGGIMIFNNGLDRPIGFSEIDVIEPPQSTPGAYGTPSTGEVFGPSTKAWNYRAEDPVTFYSFFISGARRSASGNTLICEGEKGRLFEVTHEGEKVWEYVNPETHVGMLSSTEPIPSNGGGAYQGNLVFRAEKYPVDFPGFNGHDLSTGVQLEADPFIECSILSQEHIERPAVGIHPNPAHGSVVVMGMDRAHVYLFDPTGRLVKSSRLNTDREHIDLSGFGPGLYLLRFERGGSWSSEVLLVN